MNFEEHHIDVGGLPTRYLTAGTTGPPLVLLHGVGDNALDWQWVMPTLARTQRVYALDLPGSGGSNKPDVDYSPAFLPNSSPRSWTPWRSSVPRWSATL